MSKCQCPLTGYCETHKLNLTPEQHRQCREVDGMFEAFALLGSKEKRKLAPPKSRGLGDTIANFTKKTRLDRAAKLYTKITGKPCGCDKRRELWNRLFPYK